MIRVLALAALLLPVAEATSPAIHQACEILTLEEVRRFIPDAQERPGIEAGVTSDCGWAADPNGTTIGVALTREDKFTAEGTTAIAYFDAMVANPAVGPMEVIHGVGDRAAIEESEGEDARFVYVAAGNDLLILTIIFLPREAAIEIARLAVRRM